MKHLIYQNSRARNYSFDREWFAAAPPLDKPSPHLYNAASSEGKPSGADAKPSQAAQRYFRQRNLD
jgi:hypothetical protein